MATNRADTLDPALLRPGRLDRKIEFPLPDRRQKRLVFQTITAKMNLSDEVDLEDYVARPDRISGADINAICQEVKLLPINFGFKSNNFSQTNILDCFLFRLVCTLCEKTVTLCWPKILKRDTRTTLRKTSQSMNSTNKYFILILL